MRLNTGNIFRALAIPAAAAFGFAFWTMNGDAAVSAGKPVADAAETAPRPAQAIEIAEAAVPPSTLPGGASSLRETFSDWQVACAVQGAGSHCALLQSQSQQNGQRVLAIELSATSGATVEGILVLPFGLALENGVALRIDDQPEGQSFRFRTCLPAGCVVPVTFDAKAVKSLRNGISLKVAAMADGGAEQAFAISLKGFAAALDRISALSN